MTVKPILSPRTVRQLQRLALRGHNISAVLRRGTTTLAAQQVAIVLRGTPRFARAEAATAATADGLMIGAHDMDAQQGDRLTIEGVVYEVVLIQPDREIETLCSLEARQ